MPTTRVAILPHDQAVVEALEQMEGDHPVGLAEAPDGALRGVQEQSGPDYVVVYPISGLRSGGLRDPYEDVELVYQTTVVARNAEGARALIDKIEAAFARIEIPDRLVVRVRPDNVGDVRPDLSVVPLVFLATPRWRLWTTPS